MDFDADLGDLVDEALGTGGVDIDNVIKALQVKLFAVRDLRREGGEAPDDPDAFSSFDDADEHRDDDWE